MSATHELEDRVLETSYCAYRELGEMSVRSHSVDKELTQGLQSAANDFAVSNFDKLDQLGNLPLPKQFLEAKASYIGLITSRTIRAAAYEQLAKTTRLDVASLLSGRIITANAVEPVTGPNAAALYQTNVVGRHPLVKDLKIEGEFVDFEPETAILTLSAPNQPSKPVYFYQARLWKHDHLTAGSPVVPQATIQIH